MREDPRGPLVIGSRFHARHCMPRPLPTISFQTPSAEFRGLYEHYRSILSYSTAKMSVCIYAIDRTYRVSSTRVQFRVQFKKITLSTALTKSAAYSHKQKLVTEMSNLHPSFPLTRQTSHSFLVPL